MTRRRTEPGADPPWVLLRLQGQLDDQEPDDQSSRSRADKEAQMRPGRSNTARCGTCGATFETASALEAHLLDAYHGFQCLRCGALFARHDQLDDHLPCHGANWCMTFGPPTQRHSALGKHPGRAYGEDATNMWGPSMARQTVRQA